MWHNPNAHAPKHRNKWESKTLTMCATVGAKCQRVNYTTNTCISCIYVSTCKVDYMMANTFVYVAVILNYNNVMHILPELYRVATIVEH